MFQAALLISVKKNGWQCVIACKGGYVDAGGSVQVIFLSWGSWATKSTQRSAAQLFKRGVGGYLAIFVIESQTSQKFRSDIRQVSSYLPFSYLELCCLLAWVMNCVRAANLSTHPIFLWGQLEEVASKISFKVTLCLGFFATLSLSSPLILALLSSNLDDGMPYFHHWASGRGQNNFRQNFPPSRHRQVSQFTHHGKKITNTNPKYRMEQCAMQCQFSLANSDQWSHIWHLH